MSSSSDTEREILLGNKHLLTIFFVIAALLGVAFTGGYMVGHGSSDKRAAVAPTTDPAAGSQATSTPPSSVPTLSVNPDSTASDNAAHEQPASPPSAITRTAERAPAPEEPPLNPRKSSKSAPAQAETAPPSAEVSPKTGQTFLQVAAVRRTEADALAEVLRQKGFRAHSVQKPGSPDVFRVLIGPVRDTGNLSATRDALRNTGFTKVIVQRY